MFTAYNEMIGYMDGLYNAESAEGYEPLTDEEMEILRKADKNARLIKGKVFLWESAKDWRDIWDGEDEWNVL